MDRSSKKWKWNCKRKSTNFTGTATNISVMLGVNNPSETAQMEQLLNSLHSRYSNCKVFVNSVYNVGSAYSGGVTNDSIKKYNDEIRNFCNQNEWLNILMLQMD